MDKFTYKLDLGWPYDHDFLNRELTKYANRNSLTLSLESDDRTSIFTLTGNDEVIDKLKELEPNEEALMAELVGA